MGEMGEMGKLGEAGEDRGVHSKRSLLTVNCSLFPIPCSLT